MTDRERVMIQLLQVMTIGQLEALAVRLAQVQEHGYGEIKITFWSGHVDLLDSTTRDKLTQVKEGMQGG